MAEIKMCVVISVVNPYGPTLHNFSRNFYYNILSVYLPFSFFLSPSTALEFLAIIYRMKDTNLIKIIFPVKNKASINLNK